MCTHPFLLRGGGRGEGLNLQSNFQNGEGGGSLDRTSTFRGGLLGKRGWLYSGGLQFSHKNKSKSEIFNRKKCLWAKIFFSAITKSTFTWQTKWTHTGLKFQTSVKTNSVYMKFHFISKGPNILMDMCRLFISASVYMIFYHPKCNFISVKMTNMKSIAALSFKRTCALNTTSKESALIHFVLGKLCSDENLAPVWNFISVKMTIPIWVSFRLNSCEHK